MSARAGSGGAPEGESAASQKQQPKKKARAPTHGGYRWFANLQRNSRARAEKRVKDVGADQKKKELEKHEAKKKKELENLEEAEKKKEKKKKKKRRSSSAGDQDGEGKQQDEQPPTKKAKADGQDHVRHANATAQHDSNAPLLLRMPSEGKRQRFRKVFVD